MASIHLKRMHTLGLTAARAAADRVVGGLQREHKVRTHWVGDTLMVHGRGVRGELAVSEYRVDVRVKLGLSMRLLRRTLEKEINEQLDEHLTTRA